MAAVARQRILVVDASTAMRQTVATVLADVYDVTTISDVEFFHRRIEFPETPDVLVLGASELALSNANLLRAETPTLWLVAAGLTSPGDPSSSRALSRSFVPVELRSEVERLLAEARGHAARDALLARIEPPFLTAAAAAVARQAIATQLPVLIHGQRGTGRAALARTLHELSTRGTFVASGGRSFGTIDVPAAGTAAKGTLFIDGVEHLDDAGQQRLLGLLDASDPGTSKLRIIVGTERSPDQLLAHPNLSLELYYRLAVLIVEIVPLRERPGDLPGLARLISEDLAHVLSVKPLDFTEAALERLSNHLWFGDIAELQGVLARALTLGKRDPIDASDLQFDLPRGRQTPREPSDGPGTAAATPSPTLAQGNPLELVITELAHELKNPMVSIKTFAQHLRRIGFRGPDEEQVARLAGEAIDQLDQAVENLTQFTRFDDPVRERVSLAAVLGPAVSTLSQLLKPHSRRVDYRPPAECTLLVDRAQVVYALTNLFRALTRGLGDTGRMVIGANESRITIELPTGYNPSEARLTALLTTVSARVPLPLPAALATEIIKRNGGVIAFDAHSQPPMVTVRLPAADEEEVAIVHHAQTPRSHR